MNIRRILVAEDDPRDEELTLAALEQDHLAHKVFVVRDGAETLDYLYCRGKFKLRTTGLPAALLLDLTMPKVGGLEVLRIIKSDEHLKTIPVVVLSSSRESPDVAECYRLGVNAYVVKPVDFGQFLQAVKHLGMFWIVVNEPPPEPGRRAICQGEKDGNNGKANPHPSLGG